MTRKDVIVVASVSCIYNIGSPVEYGRFILELKKVSKANAAANLEWAIEKCGLKERRKSIIGNLSKGLRQRVGLAQAVIHRSAWHLEAWAVRPPATAHRRHRDRRARGPAHHLSPSDPGRPVLA